MIKDFLKERIEKLDERTGKLAFLLLNGLVDGMTQNQLEELLLDEIGQFLEEDNNETE